MKKVFRILIPILLIIALLVGVYWYLLHYDRAFTRDIILSTARHFESIGNQHTAAWFYDFAYRLGDGSDAVAIELARQYVRTGSFTKAENTLLRAIKDGGGEEVYIALSKIYIQQGKLMDAVDLIDHVQDSEIWASLQEIRPDAPQPDHEPGFYNQYIQVGFPETDGVYYINIHGEFPVTRTDLYQEPIQLGDGQTSLHCLVVGNNGLVSEPVVLEYTIGGVIEPVTFIDPSVEASVRSLLGIADDKTVYTNHLWDIKEFTVPQDAQSLEDLRHMIYLESLTAENLEKNLLSVLQDLGTLRQLHLSNIPVSSEELEIIGSLSKLTHLSLVNCNITTTTPLGTLTQMEYLNLNTNAIRNLQALKSMTKLKEVDLAKNALTEVSALAYCSDLEYIDISYNTVSSIAPVCSLTHLKSLKASTNSIVNLGDIGSLTNLTELDVSQNQIFSLSSLSNCSMLSEVNISNNEITDIRSLSELTQLTRVNFAYNLVTELPQWPMNCNLVSIDGSYNQITSVAALTGLQALNSVAMDYNEGLSDISPLATCPKLMQINVFGTDVTDISAFSESSIVIHYDPTVD